MITEKTIALIKEKATKWLNPSIFDEQTSKEVAKELEKQNWSILSESFSDLKFGTGGLRAICGIGDGLLNSYTVSKAALAIANIHLKKDIRPKLALSYDTRRHSEKFINIVSKTLLFHGIDTYIFEKPTSVPVLSYVIRKKKLSGGIMITASHNPEEYNGIKVYGSDGRQVTSPEDEEIEKEFSSLEYFNFSKIVLQEEFSGDHYTLGEEIEEELSKKISSQLLIPELGKRYGNDLKIIYTPLHGVGRSFLRRLMKNSGYSSVKTVSEQANTDEGFSTIKSPNPEDVSSFKLAIDYVESSKADLAFATDPDADRMACWSPILTPGLLSGNLTAALVLDFKLSQLSQQGRLPKNPYIVRSMVSSPLLDKIIESFGGRSVLTGTGFKWIGREIDIHGEDNFVMGCEESYGILMHPFCRDKDGPGSILHFSEMALWWKRQGLNLSDALENLFEKYGRFYDHTFVEVFEGSDANLKRRKIIENLRKNPIAMIGDFEVSGYSDFLNKVKISYKFEEKKTLLGRPMNLLRFYFGGGHSIDIRESGTEPKIKYYLHLSPEASPLTSEELKVEFPMIKDKIQRAVNKWTHYE